MYDTLRRSGRRLTILSMLPLLTACASADGDQPNDAGTQDGLHGVLIDPPLAKPDFVLTDTEGAPFDFRAETEGQVALLFFGFTNCPDACPVHLANIAAVLQRFPYDVRSQVRVVFVTTDPERDTPERMREWLDGFDPSFVGLRGDTAEVARIQQGLMMMPSVRQPTPDGGYMVGHAAQVVAFTADGVAHVIYPSGVRQEDWEHDIPRLVAQSADGS